MKYILCFVLLLSINKNFNALSVLPAPVIDDHFVRKGVGEHDSIIEEYHKCISETSDFIFYDIDLYNNEYLEISCGKKQELEPLKDDKYFEKSNYVNKLGGPYQIIDFKDSKPFSDLSYEIETKYFPRGKYWRVYNKGHKTSGELQSIYLHCYNTSKTVNSTIQINLIGDWKLLKKENEFVFDKDKFSSDGKNLTYIKSMRPSTLIKTTCKDSDINVTYGKGNPTSHLSYSPYKLLSNSLIQYRDISKEILEIKDKANIIDLRESNTTLIDLERCQTVITCSKDIDRKLIYVYPKYDEIAGLNPKSKEALVLRLTGSNSTVNSFSVDTLKNKIVSFHIPTGSVVVPANCPNEMKFMEFIHPENVIKNLKVTQISEGISILDTSSALNNTQVFPYCTVSSGGLVDDEIGMFLEIPTTCDISNKEETPKDFHCTIYTTDNSNIVIRSSEDEKSKLSFIEKFYSRDYSKDEGTDDIWYTETFSKLIPKITKKGETEVHIEIKTKMVENPLYLVSGKATGTSVKNPDSVVEIHLSEIDVYSYKNRVAYVTKKVTTKTEFYSLILEDEPWKLSCSSFLEYKDERPNRPYIYPTEHNKVLLSIPNGKIDIKTLKPVSITDHFGISGYEFSTSSKFDDLEINVDNPFIYSDYMRPIYYACLYDTTGIETRGIIDPYAVIQIIPMNKRIGKEQCGIKGALKNELDEKIPCNVFIKTTQDKFGYFCPTYLDVPKPEKYPLKYEAFKTPLSNQIECKYGNDKATITVGKDEFYDLIYPEGKDSPSTSMIFLSSETPIFKKKMGNIITCGCKGRDSITAHVDQNVPIIGSLEDGFLGLTLGFSFLSILLGSFYSI